MFNSRSISLTGSGNDSNDPRNNLNSYSLGNGVCLFETCPTTHGHAMGWKGDTSTHHPKILPWRCSRSSHRLARGSRGRCPRHWYSMRCCCYGGGGGAGSLGHDMHFLLECCVALSDAIDNYRYVLTFAFFEGGDPNSRLTTSFLSSPCTKLCSVSITP